MKYLFVCYSNKQRSPTAEEVCKKIAKEKDIEVKVISAGVDADEDKNQFSEFLVETSDKIFVMEDYMKEIIVNEFKGNSNKIISLNIPDVYHKNDPELIVLLEQKLSNHL